MSRRLFSVSFLNFLDVDVLAVARVLGLFPADCASFFKGSTNFSLHVISSRNVGECEGSRRNPRENGLNRSLYKLKVCKLCTGKISSQSSFCLTILRFYHEKRKETNYVLRHFSAITIITMNKTVHGCNFLREVL